MENMRALYLVGKSELSPEDKEFLKKHLELYSDILYSKEIEIMRLKDIIDKGKYLDNSIMTVKEQIKQTFLGEKDKKEMLIRLDRLLS